MRCEVLKKYKWNILFIVLSLFFLIYYIFFVNDIRTLPSVILSLSPVWISLAIFLMLIYWLSESTVLHMIIKSLDPKARFLTSLSATMTGLFFNGITPFATGGFPMQIVMLTKYQVPLGIATTSLLSKSLVYQINLIVYTTILLFWKLNFFVDNVSSLAYLALLGYAVNLVVIAGIFSLLYFKKPVQIALELGFKILSKFKIKKDPARIKEKLDRESAQLREAFLTLTKNKILFLKALFASMLQLTAYLLVPYAILRGFGISSPNTDVVTVASAGAFVLLISAFIPLPGGSGAAEGSFGFLFSLFLPTQIIGVSVLIWRFLTYYLSILIGALFSMRLGFRTKQKPIRKRQSRI